MLRGLPRARHIVAAIVRCPLLGRDVAADLQWEDWTLRYVDVARCAVLGGYALACNRRCIARDAPMPLRRIP